MRLYITAESEKRIGYTPDWLKVSFFKDNEEFELTLDINGEIDYDTNCLNCSCKGDFIPWTLLNMTTGVETDLSELSLEEVQIQFPIAKIAEILHIASAEGQTLRIGIYPVDYTNTNQKTFYESDKLSLGSGSCSLHDGQTTYEISFHFETELNL